MRPGNTAFREAMNYPVGTILSLSSWGKDGAGPMGDWLVGGRTLWDISEIMGLDSTKARHPSKLYQEIKAHEVLGTFHGLDWKKRCRIIEMLRTKTAEGGRLVKTLQRDLPETTSSCRPLPLQAMA